MAAISFVFAYKELQIAQINQLFQLLNLICAYGDAFYGLTCMLMNKNVNNDISKNFPGIQQFHILYYTSLQWQQQQQKCLSVTCKT